MLRFLLSMCGLACRRCTVLNMLCLLRNEGFPSFCLCASFVLCIVQKVARMFYPDFRWVHAGRES